MVMTIADCSSNISERRSRYEVHGVTNTYGEPSAALYPL